MPSPMQGFDDDSQLFIEPIRGIRAFGMDRTHPTNLILTGLVYNDYGWEPGWNQRKCLGNIINVLNLDGEVVSTFQVPRHKGESHTLQECSCGFYAYHDYSLVAHQYGTDMPLILGVIEGSGATMLGPKGFRSDKARVVAVCLPEKVRGHALEGLFKFSVRASYPEIEIFDYPVAMLERYPLTYVDKYYAEGLD